MKRFLNALCLVILGVSALSLAGSFIVRQNLAQKAQLIQRVRVSEEAALFGEVGDLIGPEQMLIIEDPSVFLNKSSISGAKLVDQNLLDQKGIYPLQLQSVDFVATSVRWTSLAALLLSSAGLLLLKRAKKRVNAHQLQVEN